MGGGQSRCTAREEPYRARHGDGVLDDSSIPPPPRWGPKSSCVSTALESAETVTFHEANGDAVAFACCRSGAVEKIVNRKWACAVSVIVPLVSLRGAEPCKGPAGVRAEEGLEAPGEPPRLQLVTRKGAVLCTPVEHGRELLRRVSALVALCDAAAVRHSLDPFVISDAAEATGGGGGGDGICTDCNVAVGLHGPFVCAHTGRYHRGPEWGGPAVPLLPSGAQQGCPSPSRTRRCTRDEILQALARDETLSVETPGGATKLVLKMEGRLEVYSPTNEWMYSAQRVMVSGAELCMQLMCHETGIYKYSIRNVRPQALHSIGRLADRAKVGHNVWNELEYDAPHHEERHAFVCPACTYRNASGAVCRLCQAARPDADAPPLLVGAAAAPASAPASPSSAELASSTHSSDTTTQTKARGLLLRCAVCSKVFSWTFLK
eukprot:TRINITY_DN1252_c0_g1_i1.p1 TRINITY_DN1252_c0_g1~~TRINITY_DN1252_c0_g1_i1.p1  ORF type:complete len:434 (+),score=107.83 TRINITY_DN1252_c0_g1_i1:127-1428(+)